MDCETHTVACVLPTLLLCCRSMKCRNYRFSCIELLYFIRHRDTSSSSSQLITGSDRRWQILHVVSYEYWTGAFWTYFSWVKTFHQYNLESNKANWKNSCVDAGCELSCLLPSPRIEQDRKRQRINDNFNSLYAILSTTKLFLPISAFRS